MNITLRALNWGVWGWAFVCLAHLPAAWAEQATVYQCQDKKGAVVFSGTPCGPDAKARVIEAPNAGTGGAAARQGIDALAKQYDQRQALARKEAAETARAEAQAQAAEQARAALIPPSTIQNDYYYGGYPLPGGYWGAGTSGFGGSINSRGQWSVGGYVGDEPRRLHRSYDHDHDRVPAPYRPPESPGISGRFPGGIPGMRE